MNNIVIRDYEPRDKEFVLNVNEINVEVLSPMDEEKLAYFVKNAALFQTVEVDGTPAAFLIALREGLADYWSENYKWFSSQYPSFLYVDRIVIDEPFRRLGLGQKLYEGVFARASEAGLPVVTAEVDIEPVYNDTSIRFHEAMGFEEVGQQIIRGGSIKVSLRAKTL